MKMMLFFGFSPPVVGGTFQVAVRELSDFFQQHYEA